MGLIHNLLVGIIHLVFVAMDILVIMVLVKVVYDRWQLGFLKHITNAIEPLMKFIVAHLDTWATRITGKTYSEKTLWLLIILCLLLVRLMCGL